MLVLVYSIVIQLYTAMHRPKSAAPESRELLPVQYLSMYTKPSSEKAISQHYAPLRTFVDINVIFLPFFFLLLVVGVAWWELLGPRLLASI